MIGLIVNTLGIAAGVLALAVEMAPMRSRPRKEYTTVAYCDLVRNPERYKQNPVRVSAVYRYGYEWSELYCLECATESTTWVEFDDSFSTSTKAGIRKKLGDNGFKGRTVLVTMVGKLDTGGGYGHMGAYRYRLMVESVEKADVILNDSPVPNALPKKVLRRIHCPQ